MTEEQMRKKLRAMMTKWGDQGRLAKALSVSPTYVSNVLHGRKPPGQKILDALGLERVVTYRKKESP